MEKKEKKTPVVKERAEKYDTKLSVSGSFAQIVKVVAKHKPRKDS